MRFNAAVWWQTEALSLTSKEKKKISNYFLFTLLYFHRWIYSPVVYCPQKNIF